MHRRTDDALGERAVLERRQAQVADLHRAGDARDEDVVALEVAVDDRRVARVQEVQALEDLPAPRLQHLQLDLLEAPQVPAIINRSL